MIEGLEPDEIFVFGSNLEGHHDGGAANQALRLFGAIYRVGIGLMGQSYAIPTMFEFTNQIEPYIEQFKQVAELLPKKRFLLTRIGCGIAGFTDEQMAPMFKDMPDNVILPKEWL